MLVNNAGVVSGRALLDTPDHLIERSFNVNVLAHFWVCKCIDSNARGNMRLRSKHAYVTQLALRRDWETDLH